MDYLPTALGDAARNDPTFAFGTFQKCPAKLTMFVDGSKADVALGCDEV
jgi:hypothetical protein